MVEDIPIVKISNSFVIFHMITIATLKQRVRPDKEKPIYQHVNSTLLKEK